MQKHSCRSIVSIYSVSRNVLLGCPTFHHTFACRWGSRVQARPLHVLLHPFFAELLCCKRRDGWTIGSQNGGLVKIDFVWKKKTTVKTWWCKLWTMKNSILLGRSYTYGTLFFVLVKRLCTWDTLCHLGGLLAKTLRPGMYLWGCVLRRTKIKRCSVASVVLLFFKRNVEGFHILVDIVENQGRSNNCSASVRTQIGVRAG